MEKLEKYLTILIEVMIWLSVIIVAMFTLEQIVEFYTLDMKVYIKEIDKNININNMFGMFNIPAIHYNSTPTLGYVVTTTMSMNHYMNHKFIMESKNENKEI